MMYWKILTFAYASLLFIEAKQFKPVKRETHLKLCNTDFKNANKIQCRCSPFKLGSSKIHSAICYLTADVVAPDDQVWNSFDQLKDTSEIFFTNTTGITLKYIPTNALKHTKEMMKLDVKYGNIETIDSFAFANHSIVEEISLRDNQIRILKVNAFAHHQKLKSINLDTNNIIEINRRVLTDLPSLEKLYLTNNKIITIHDRAFVHLSNLRELKLDRNNIFSLNSETFSELKNLDKLDISSNSLEIISDKTFLPLTRLRILNLDGNKLQMIDERGFDGLSNLKNLSLAYKELQEFENLKIFEGLTSLTSLSLKANPLNELKSEVMAPILSIFYGPKSSLDEEDIDFPCNCRLERFVALMNKTSSKHLKQTLENLKCNPDLREIYNNSAPLFEDEQEEPQKSDKNEQSNKDYELYDDTHLDRKLFYNDLKLLWNCPNSLIAPQITKVTTTTTKSITKVREDTLIRTTIKATPSPIFTIKAIQDINQELLDLSMNVTTSSEHNNDIKNVSKHQDRKDKMALNTSTRLPTVPAMPVENKCEKYVMATDKTVTNNNNAHKSIQNQVEDSNHKNNEMNEFTSIRTTTEAASSPIFTTTKAILVTNHGLLDPSIDVPAGIKHNKDSKNIPENKDQNAFLYTTIRPLKVSVKQMENKYKEYDVASEEEAGIKIFEIILDQVKDSNHRNKTNKTFIKQLYYSYVLHSKSYFIPNYV